MEPSSSIPAASFCQSFRVHDGCTFFFGAIAILAPIAYVNKKIKLKTCLLSTFASALAAMATSSLAPSNTPLQQRASNTYRFSSTLEFKEFIENFSPSKGSKTVFDFSGAPHLDVRSALSSMSSHLSWNNDPSDFEVIWGQRNLIKIKLPNIQNHSLLWQISFAPENSKLCFLDLEDEIIIDALKKRLKPGSFKINSLKLRCPEEQSWLLLTQSKVDLLILADIPSDLIGFIRGILEARPVQFEFNFCCIETDIGKPLAAGDNDLLELPPSIWKEIETAGYKIEVIGHNAQAMTPTFEELKNQNEAAIQKMNGKRRVKIDGKSFAIQYRFKRDKSN